WDPASLRSVGTAIRRSGIGLTPTVDGPSIRLYVPALSEDRRRELALVVHKRVDQARVDIRTIRHEALSEARRRERARPTGADGARRETVELQKLTDRFVEEVARRGQVKEAAILRV